MNGLQVLVADGTSLPRSLIHLSSSKLNFQVRHQLSMFRTSNRKDSAIAKTWTFLDFYFKKKRQSIREALNIQDHLGKCYSGDLNQVPNKSEDELE